MKDLWDDEEEKSSRVQVASKVRTLGGKVYTTATPTPASKIDSHTGQGKQIQVERPDGVTWSVPATFFKRVPFTPRERPAAGSFKNSRSAVALPHAGQSYNPTDVDHQAALQVAAKQLERKQRQHQKFVHEMTRTEVKLKSDSNQNQNQNDAAANEAEDLESKAVSKRTEASRRQQLKELNDKRKKKKKKMTRSELAQEKRLEQKGRFNKEMKKFDEILGEVEKKQDHQRRLAEFRKAQRAQKKQTVAFGRHHYQPVALEVAPSTALTGSLRQGLARAGKNAVIHPVMDRVKSLEERNMVPARMRHKYNKKKEILQPGQIHLQKEQFGTMRTHKKEN